MVTRDIRIYRHSSRDLNQIHLPHAGVRIVSRSLPDDDVGGIVRTLERVNRLSPDGLPSYGVMYLTPVEP